MKQVSVLWKKYCPFFVVLLFCSWAVIPLFHAGFFPMHDDEQVARLFEMSKVLTQGQIPPRWVPDLGFGFGYPLFNFYPPLVYYIGALFHFAGFTYITSTKLVMGLGFFLSGLFMYLWTKNRFGILGGLLAAFLYIYAPYHSVDIYVRGALSEFFSFVFIPALFWSLDTLARNPSRKHILLASFMFCLVILTHTLVALQLAPFLFFYLAFLLWEQRKNWRKVLLVFFVFGLLGFGLSAYFTIPSVLEKQYTLVDQILTKELASYAIHFVCPVQFWNSPWGYGGSAANCVTGLSFQVGKVHILLAALSLFLIVFLFFKKRNYGIALFAFTMFIFSLFLATSYSKFIWNSLQPFSYIQFPWRFLLISTLFASFLGGFVLSTIQSFVNKKLVLGIFVLICLSSFYLVNQYFKPVGFILVGDDHYTQGDDISWRVSGLSYEYVPKQVATRLSSLSTTELAINRSDIPKTSFTPLSGSMSLSVLRNSATRKDAIVTAKNSGILQVNTYSFPGWVVMMDGKRISYQDTNSLHLIQIPIVSGKHTLTVQFLDTPIRFISDIISVLSILVFVSMFLIRKYVDKKYT